MNVEHKGPVNLAFTTKELKAAYMELGCDKSTATIAFPVYDASIDQVVDNPTIGQLLGALMRKIPYRVADTEG